MTTSGFASGMRAARMVCVFLAAIGLVNCGGGGGGGGTTTTPPAADPAGYYGTSGTLDYKNVIGLTVNATKVQGIVKNNQILLFSSDGFDIYDIHISSISGNDFTGTAKVYEFGGPAQYTSDLTVSGTITAGSSITGTFSGTGNFGQGTFSLVYNDQMGTIPTSPSNNWQLYVAGNNIDFITDGAGGIASGTAGTPVGVLAPAGVFANCVVNPAGTTTVIGSSKIYKVTLTLAGDGGGTCAFAGDYTGYVVAQDATPTALAMALVVKDGSTAFGGSFVYIP